MENVAMVPVNVCVCLCGCVHVCVCVCEYVCTCMHELVFDNDRSQFIALYFLHGSMK